ncbi:glycosyltransferase 87 family protein [Kitasatospora sp. NPDC059646]|uniref:glycosyltransferase 87 family protein n=1 Tax=Kitasatospora sp. NPDC059646 TaxID=3346893 RepID=UPI00369E5801
MASTRPPAGRALPGAARGGGRVPAQRGRRGGRAGRLMRHPAVQAGGWLVAAGWAEAFPLVSDLANQVAWGRFAAPAYLLAAVLTVALPRGLAARAATSAAVLGAVLLPLGVLALTGRHQSEVTVVERSAALLLHTGSPYLPHPAHVVDYNPYLPAMSLFGLPRVVLGEAWPAARLLGDARPWFAAAFLACLVAGWRLLRPGPRWAPALPLAVLTGSPLIAQALAVGGVDLPLIGVCCLAMALAERGHPLRTGLVLAVACALKWTAWPALPVALFLLHRRHGPARALRAAGPALAVGGAVIGPFVVLHPRELYEQVVRFPLGLTALHTPAGSPLPGKVLAGLGPSGHTVSLTLLCAGALAVALWLPAHPPATAVAACDLLAAGLTVAFALAPAGRFGYLALPAVLVLWPRLAAAAGRPVPEPPPRPTHRQAVAVPIVSGDRVRTRE